MKEIIEQRFLKIVSGVVAGCAGLLAPAVPLMIAALCFMVIDFLTGVLADRRIARSEGRAWHFESRRAWRSVRKVSLVMVGIVMASALDGLLGGVLPVELAKLYTGFVCGVEFWSYLENASVLSDKKLFCSLRRLVGDRLEKAVGEEFNMCRDEQPRVEE